MTKEEFNRLNQLFQKYPDLSDLYTAIHVFRDLVKMSQGFKICQLLDRYSHQKIKELREFCRRMKHDEQSIMNALVYPYTNAICEGNINRIKIIKRQMYRRACFELLRIKVIYV